MEKLDLILWIMSGGFTIMFTLMIIMWNELRNEIKDLRKDIHDLRKDVQDIDKRLCRLEGAFSAKDFCLLKNNDHVKRFSWKARTPRC